MSNASNQLIPTFSGISLVNPPIHRIPSDLLYGLLMSLTGESSFQSFDLAVLLSHVAVRHAHCASASILEAPHHPCLGLPEGPLANCTAPWSTSTFTRVLRQHAPRARVRSLRAFASNSPSLASHLLPLTSLYLTSLEDHEALVWSDRVPDTFTVVSRFLETEKCRYSIVRSTGHANLAVSPRPHHTFVHVFLPQIIRHLAQSTLQHLKLYFQSRHTGISWMGPSCIYLPDLRSMALGYRDPLALVPFLHRVRLPSLEAFSLHDFGMCRELHTPGGMQLHIYIQCIPPIVDTTFHAPRRDPLSRFAEVPAPHGLAPHGGVSPTIMETLPSEPSYDSIHKYELPARNLLPPAPKDTAEHLEQIAQQLFALCYNVESFVGLPNEKHLPGFNPTIWNFFHQVIRLLPRTLDPKGIDDSLVSLYEALFHSQKSAPPKVSELVNPGADVPEALTLFADGVPGTQTIELDTAVNGNAWRKRKEFSVIQNALSQTDLVEYTLEFIPDEVPTAELDGQSGPSGTEVHDDRPEPPKSAPKRKAPAKGKGKAKAKGKAVVGEGAKAADNQGTGRKKTTSAPAKPRTRTATTSTRAPSARLAAKTVKFVEPPTSPPPSRVPAKHSLLVPPTRTRIWNPPTEPVASSSNSNRPGRKRERPTEDEADESPAQKKSRSLAEAPKRPPSPRPSSSRHYHGRKVVVGGVQFTLTLK
ncbi:hypothetical protein B0H19DRAFT_1376647 [Mycena capillaripes]|nr:hypothetical protein B0H19DRAFT_1376647 [Mycena capillaripes]